MLARPEHEPAASGPIRIEFASPTRQRILGAARALLRDGSYRSFSMDALARACGLSRQTLYNVFTGRDPLYRASRRQLLDAFAGDLPRLVSPAGEPSRSLERFIDLAFGALGRSEHAELSRSADVDRDACPWIEALYANNVERVLTAAIRSWMPSHGAAARLADPATRAAELVMMIRAATREPGATPLFSAGELATLFLRRVMASSPAPHLLARAG